MLAASLVFGSFMTVLFMIVGVIGGWVAREYIMNYHDAPRLHPEFFDDNGTILDIYYSNSDLYAAYYANSPLAADSLGVARGPCE